MEGLFLKLLNISLTASWLVVALILVRLLFRRMPKWITCALWGLVAVRLVLPISWESEWSLIPGTKPVSQAIENVLHRNVSGAGSNAEDWTEISSVHSDTGNTSAESVHSDADNVGSAYSETGNGNIGSAHLEVGNVSSATVLDAENNQITGAPNREMESQIGLNSEIQNSSPSIWLTVLSGGWIVGMLLLFLYSAISYIRLHRRVATAIPFEKGVKQSEFIDTPFILGVFRPIVYLPFSLEEEDTGYVLAHEKAHLQRRDHLWKPFGFAVLAVYWFNPMLWVAYLLFCRDIESACDERVIDSMEMSDRKAYGTALLHCSVSRRSIAACPLAFGETGVKQRIQGVMNYRKPTFWVIVAATVAGLVLVIGFMTNPKQKPEQFRMAGNAVVFAEIRNKKDNTIHYELDGMTPVEIDGQMWKEKEQQYFFGDVKVKYLENLRFYEKFYKAGEENTGVMTLFHHALGDWNEEIEYTDAERQRYSVAVQEWNEQNYFDFMMREWYRKDEKIERADSFGGRVYYGKAENMAVIKTSSHPLEQATPGESRNYIFVVGAANEDSAVALLKAEYPFLVEKSIEDVVGSDGFEEDDDSEQKDANEPDSEKSGDGEVSSEHTTNEIDSSSVPEMVECPQGIFNTVPDTVWSAVRGERDMIADGTVVYGTKWLDDYPKLTNYLEIKLMKEKERQKYTGSFCVGDWDEDGKNEVLLTTRKGFIYVFAETDNGTELFPYEGLQDAEFEQRFPAYSEQAETKYTYCNKNLLRTVCPDFADRPTDWEIWDQGEELMQYYRYERGATLIIPNGEYLYMTSDLKLRFQARLVGDHDNIYYSKEVEGIGTIDITRYDMWTIPLAKDCKMFYHSKTNRDKAMFLTPEEMLLIREHEIWVPYTNHMDYFEGFGPITIFVENGEIVYIYEKFVS